MNTGGSVIDFLRRDLALLKRIGTEEQKKQIPIVEAQLDQFAEQVGAAVFATEKPKQARPEGSE